MYFGIDPSFSGIPQQFNKLDICRLTYVRSSAPRNATMDPTSALQRICVIHGREFKMVARHFKFHPYSFLVRIWRTFGLVSLTPILCTVNASAYGGVLSYANNRNWYNGWWPHNSPIGQISIQYQTPLAILIRRQLLLDQDPATSTEMITEYRVPYSWLRHITAYWNNQWISPKRANDELHILER